MQFPGLPLLSGQAWIQTQARLTAKLWDLGPRVWQHSLWTLQPCRVLRHIATNVLDPSGPRLEVCSELLRSPPPPGLVPPTF